MSGAKPHRIQLLTADQVLAELHGLSTLLEDAVSSGASIGFLHPMHPGEAADYPRLVSTISGNSIAETP